MNAEFLILYQELYPMSITIRKDKNYGNLVYYPACDRSTLFARIAGTKTLTAQTIDAIKAIGFEVKVVW
jgi:hypothetical protein